MEFKEGLQPSILLCPPLLLCNECSPSASTWFI